MSLYAKNGIREIYWRAPLPLQNLAVSVYGSGLVLRYEGTAYRKWMAELRRSERFSRDQLEALQEERLRGFLEAAYTDSPYWERMLGAAGLSPGDRATTEDLQRLPLLDKEGVIAHSQAIRSSRLFAGLSRRHIVWVQTSGTTGKALRLAITKDAMARESAFRDLHRSWGGVARGDSSAVLMSFPIVPVEQDRPPYWRYNRAQNQLIFSSPHISTATLPDYLDQLASFQPKLIQGFPSGVYLIALGCLDRGERRVRPRAVYTGSETLLPNQRQVIEEAFGCKVFDWYGNTELAGNIVECECGSRHVKMDHSLTEFITESGRAAAPGETGEIVCTAFGNPAMPLIRYRTGDLAVVGRGTCACGRGGQLVEEIVGRVNDFIVTPEGKHVRVSSDVFRHLPTISEAQMTQTDVSSMKVLYVPRPEFHRSDLSFIERTIRNYVGQAIAIEFEAVDCIPRDRGGKYRYVISKIPISLGSTQVRQS